jgi:plasmid replication initiation protein
VKVKDQMPKRVVSQSNALVGASYRLSLTEKRLVMLAASKIDSKKPLAQDHCLNFTAVEYAAFFGINRNDTANDLKEAVAKLWDREINLLSNDGEVTTSLRWINKKVTSKKGSFTLRFNPEILEHLSDLQKNFTQVSLREAGKLQSFYSFRLYELLSQYQRIGKREISVEDLRQMLDVVDKFKTTALLQKFVVQPACEEISLKTDVLVTWIQQKTGRKVSGWKFYLDKKQQADLFAS